MHTTNWRAFLENLQPFDLGTCVDGRPLQLTWDQIKVHMAILGGSGSGKSFFIELLLRNFMNDGLGFCFIDPHGDSARNLVAFAAALKALGDDTLWRRIHYVEISAKCAVSFNPFASLPKPGDVSRKEFAALLFAKVVRVARALLRRVPVADQEIMTRLRKWLKSILYVCGTPLDDEGTHYGLGKALVFTDPDDPEFEPLITKVWARLPRWVQRNFAKLRAAKGPKGDIIREKLESTVGRLVDICSPLMEEVLGQRRPSIDVRQIIAEGGFLIVNMGQTPTWSHDDKVVLGGLFIDEVLMAKEADGEVVPSRRPPFVLVVDEVGEYLGEDLQRSFGTHRKYVVPVIVGTQDSTTMEQGDLNMLPRVLSQCGTVVTFQQTFRPDKELLADRIGAGDLRWTKRLREVQRQRGLLEVKLRDRGGSRQRGRSWNETEGRSETDSESETVNGMISEIVTLVRSLAESNGTSETVGEGENSDESEGSSASMVPIVAGRQVLGMAPAPSPKGSLSHSERKGTSRNRASGKSKNVVEGQAESHGQVYGSGRARMKAKARGRNQNRGRGGSASETRSWSEKTQLVPNLVSEWEWDGQYEEGTVADQLERLMQRIHCLSTAEAIVSARGERHSKEVRIARVEEWWEDEDDKFLAVERLKALLFALRPYYFNPSLEPDQADPPVAVSETEELGN